MLFVQAILGGFQRGGRGKNRDALSQKLGRLDGNVFKLVGDQFEAGGELGQRSAIREVGGYAGGNASDGGLRGWIEKAKMQAERVAGQGEHVAQLPAAENPDGHARFR